MGKKVTTSKLKKLITLLKTHFANQVSTHNIDMSAVDIHAKVVHINHKTLKTENIRIPEHFLDHNLPIPPNSVLQVHIDIPQEVSTAECNRYRDKIIHGLSKRDVQVKDHRIVFNNLKVMKTIEQIPIT